MQKFCSCCRQGEIRDDAVKRIAKGVHGPLLEALAQRAGYGDSAAVELFRKGAPVVGVLERCVRPTALTWSQIGNGSYNVGPIWPCFLFPCVNICVDPASANVRSGIGVPIQPAAHLEIAALRAHRRRKNKTLIASLKEEKNARHLLESCREDVQRGRIAPLQLAHECDLAAITLSPRFAIEQGQRVTCKLSLRVGFVKIWPGTKPDGSCKLRPIDDMSRSDCNLATAPSEKLEYESLDKFLKVIQATEKVAGKELGFWKVCPAYTH